MDPYKQGHEQHHCLPVDEIYGIFVVSIEYIKFGIRIGEFHKHYRRIRTLQLFSQVHMDCDGKHKNL